MALMAICAALMCLLALPAGAAIHQQTVFVPRVDGSMIKVLINRPVTARKIPILLGIDGSVCFPSTLEGYIEHMTPGALGIGGYARVIVEKPGPRMPPKGGNGTYRVGPDFRCSTDFKKHYTIERRVLDHLRVIEYLRDHASWWNGKLLIWGFSDGAHVAAQVGAYTPETQRMVLIGMGGGIDMAQSLKVMICGHATDPAACRQRLSRRFDEIRRDPTPYKSWYGDSNTYAAWASRLDVVDAHVLEDMKIPVLVIQGSRDGAVPIASGRALAKKLASHHNITFREIAGMGHGLGSRLPVGRGKKLEHALVLWLLKGGPVPNLAQLASTQKSP